MKKLLYLLLFINFLNATERIITLSPAINEIAFALGLGDKIIANTEFCDFPIESKNIQKVGGYGSVSLEKVVNLNPTIILNQDYESSGSLAVIINRIRHKIEENPKEPQYLHTIRGMGYKFIQ